MFYSGSVRRVIPVSHRFYHVTEIRVFQAALAAYICAFSRQGISLQPSDSQFSPSYKALHQWRRNKERLRSLAIQTWFAGLENTQDRKCITSEDFGLSRPRMVASSPATMENRLLPFRRKSRQNSILPMMLRSPWLTSASPNRRNSGSFLTFIPSTPLCEV